MLGGFGPHDQLLASKGLYAVSYRVQTATYREFVTALYDTFAHQNGKPLAGEKTPDYVRRLPLLHALFPWSRSVHIVRDGRNVALSLIDWATPR